MRQKRRKVRLAFDTLEARWVPNAAPAGGIVTAGVQQGQSATIDPLSSASDPDGDNVSLVSISTTSALGAIVTMNADGTITYDATSAAIKALAKDQQAFDSFSFLVTDDGDPPLTGSGVISITVTGINDAPTAVPDGATVIEDQSVTFDVTGNDTDPDTTDALSVQSVTTPSHGTATPSGTSITYVPNPNYYGSDSFSYTASDGNGGTATTTVSITVYSDMGKHQALYDTANNQAHQAYLAQVAALSQTMAGSIASANVSAQSDVDAAYAAYSSQEASDYAQYVSAFTLADSKLFSDVAMADDNFASSITSAASSLISALQAAYNETTAFCNAVDSADLSALNNSIGSDNDSDMQSIQAIIDSFDLDPNDPASVAQLQSLLAPYWQAIASRESTFDSAVDAVPSSDFSSVSDAYQANVGFDTSWQTAKNTWYTDRSIAQSAFDSSNSSWFAVYWLAENSLESTYQGAIAIAQSAQASSIIAAIASFASSNDSVFGTYLVAESNAQQQLNDAFAFAAPGTPAPVTTQYSEVPSPIITPGAPPPGLQVVSIATPTPGSIMQPASPPPTAPQAVNPPLIQPDPLPIHLQANQLASGMRQVAQQELAEAVADYENAVANGAPALDLYAKEGIMRARRIALQNRIGDIRSTAASIRAIVTPPVNYVPLIPR